MEFVGIYTEEERTAKIKREYTRLKKILKDLDGDKMCIRDREKTMSKPPCLTMDPKEAVAVLRAAGFNIGYPKLRDGLKQDTLLGTQAFPFGKAIQMEGGGWEFVIYHKDLRDFIQQHGGVIESA